MQAELHRLRSGELGFDEFVAVTRTRWDNIARYMMRRWDAPAGVEPDDLVQELILAAWWFAPKWDPTRGVALEKYVVYNAYDKAKKWLHTQRKALRRDDSAPSRSPVSFAALTRPDEDDPSERLYSLLPAALPVETSPEEELGGAEELALALSRLTDQRDRILFAALLQAEGDTTLAARAVCGDGRTRLALRLETESSARSAIRRALTRACGAA